MSEAITAAELDAIRAYNAQRNREWWNRQTPEERRARRQQYALAAIRRRQAQEINAQTGKTGRKGK